MMGYYRAKFCRQNFGTFAHNHLSKKGVEKPA